MSEKNKKMDKSGKGSISGKRFLTLQALENQSDASNPDSEARLYKNGIWGMDLTAVKLPPKPKSKPLSGRIATSVEELSTTKVKLETKEEAFKELVKSFKKANKSFEKARKSWKKVKKDDPKAEIKLMAKLRFQIAKQEKKAVKEEMARILEFAG
ncbi:MAG: hypothetical protein R2879_03665 [Saprospiraceae bacterium]